MSKASDRTLRRLIGRVGTLSQTDAAAVLGALTDGERRAVERLLAAQRVTASRRSAADVPVLAAILEERLAGQHPEMTERARKALRDHAAQLFGLASGEPDSLFDRVAGALRK